ncbi:putative odorant receptor 92a [Nylanderia fulva]|uniref:putative odorant receptor 92a n=1 Tax=Nylanderia fulva TaxID=613905 RepID=UPI0010FB5C2A|nr:putative odorant receptor 92a [Nylanderia fulva]
MTAQYRYIAVKLAALFREDTSQNKSKEKNNFIINSLEKELQTLCRHHNVVVQMTLMLKKVLSVNMSLLYLTNIFLFCFLDFMLINILSKAPLEAVMVIMYISGGLVQLYILCLCVHQLLDASTEITDKAFHEEWYQVKPSLKYIFMMMIISNNLGCKLSTFENFNLTLPSFMTILNQSYSFALLILRVK